MSPTHPGNLLITKLCLQHIRDICLFMTNLCLEHIWDICLLITKLSLQHIRDICRSVTTSYLQHIRDICRSVTTSCLQHIRDICLLITKLCLQHIRDICLLLSVNYHIMSPAHPGYLLITTLQSPTLPGHLSINYHVMSPTLPGHLVTTMLCLQHIRDTSALSSLSSEVNDALYSYCAGVSVICFSYSAISPTHQELLCPVLGCSRRCQCCDNTQTWAGAWLASCSLSLATLFLQRIRSVNFCSVLSCSRR